MSSEVVEPVNLDRHECRACGYIYEPEKGDARTQVAANTPFTELPVTWRCPVCGAKTTAFANIGPAGTASGFKANYSYGFGVNVLAPGIKNVLIFGTLALAVLFFLSLYSLN